MYWKIFRIFKTNSQLYDEFLEQSSIHGLKIFLLSVSARYAKKIWLAFFTLVIIWTHVLICYLIADFLHQPTELILAPNLMHVGNSPFPAVAICSANKISRRKLTAYSEQIFHAQQLYRPNLLGRNASELSEHLKSLTGFFMNAHNDFNLNEDHMENLHNLFTYMYNTTNYSLRDVIRNLAPDCEDIVIRAIVLGARINTPDFFVQRTASSSICCMFNFRRRSFSQNLTTRNFLDYVAAKSKDIKIESNSLLNRIDIVVQYDKDDVTYKHLPNDAFQVMLFPYDDYPTQQSNNMGHYLVEHNSIIEIAVQPRFLSSSSSVNEFSPKLRNCYIPIEGQKLLNVSYYSMDECLLICRIRSMVRFCGCVSPPLMGKRQNITFCNFMDLACLTKWKSVWYDWHSFDYVYSEVNETKSSYERCSYCLPTCDEIEYNFHVDVMPLRRAYGPTYTNGILTGLTNDKPLAIIKLFFLKRYALEIVKVVKADWILLLNRFGGILSLMYGFSIVSCIEIFYYLSGKWFFNFFTRKSNTKKYSKMKGFEKNDNLKEEANSNPLPNLELYWQELKPKHVKLGVFHEVPILQFPKN